MSTTQRVHRDPAAPEPPAKVDPTEMMALFTSGVKRMAEVQKKGIEIAVQQNTELVDLWRKTVEKLPGAPGLFMLELGSSGFGRYAEIQKAAIDLVVEQSHAFANLLKERTAAATQVTEDADNFRKRSVERVVALQKKVLEQSAAQAKAVVEKSYEQFGIEGSAAKTATDSIQHGVDAIVDAQKELLDMAVR
ncbi:MAG TPA: hypothetical protein VHZ09_03540 [Acidobacteriaceae bacterium]|jgi:hypothetical protein|nr:hypothetical protein [Acidobacteriaceae bacterium]